MNKPYLTTFILNFYRALAVFIVLIAAGAALGMVLVVSILERKQEAKHPFFRVVELTDK